MYSESVWQGASVNLPQQECTCIVRVYGRVVYVYSECSKAGY